eukprot:358811-Chlamydomonas_euryale.AAC.2
MNDDNAATQAPMANRQPTSQSSAFFTVHMQPCRPQWDMLPPAENTPSVHAKLLWPKPAQ